MKGLLIALSFLFTLSVYGMDARSLDDRELIGLDEERQWVQSLISGFGSDVVLNRTKADIPTLQTILDNGPYTENPKDELVVISTAFGDVLAKELELHWVVVTDEYGTDIALQYQNKYVFVFPRDMLVKRYEQNEVVDLTILFDELIIVVKDKIKNATDL